MIRLFLLVILYFLTKTVRKPTVIILLVSLTALLVAFVLLRQYTSEIITFVLAVTTILYTVLPKLFSKIEERPVLKWVVVAFLAFMAFVGIYLGVSQEKSESEFRQNLIGQTTAAKKEAKTAND